MRVLGKVLFGCATIVLLWSLEITHGVFGQQKQPPPLATIEVGAVYDRWRKHQVPYVSADGTQYLCDANGLFVMTSTGQSLWTMQGEGMLPLTGCSVSESGAVYLTDNDGLLLCVGPDGKVKWQKKLNSAQQYISPIAVSNGVWVIVRFYGRGDNLAGDALPEYDIAAYLQADGVSREDKVRVDVTLPLGSQLYKGPGDKIFAMGPITDGKREIFTVTQN